jgi:hypothetical protein
MALERIKMIRKIHSVEHTSGTTPNTTEVIDVTSFGIVDYTKCEILDNKGALDNSSWYRLVSNTALEFRNQSTTSYVRNILIKEHY